MLPRRARLDIVKAMVAKYYPPGDYPVGLLSDLYKALGEAEMRGFEECMSCFETGAQPGNDNSPT